MSADRIELVSNWSWCTCNVELGPHLGSNDSVAAFAPEGCHLTIRYSVANDLEAIAAREEQGKIREWLKERRIEVTFEVNGKVEVGNA